MPDAARRWDTPLWAVRILARAALWMIGTLLVWSVLPAVFGLSTRVVVSGSMAPALHPGDVVVATSLQGTTPHAGQVVLFTDPTQDREVVHRVVAVTTDGLLRTQGDANPTPDTTLVPLSDVHGVTRLRVPLVGLPRLWLREHDGWALGGLAVALVATLTAATDWRRSTRAG